MGGDWVAIDFETANYWPGSICSVGMTAVADGEVAGRFATYVEPPGGGGFASYNISIHGITPTLVQGAPSWPEALEQILAFVDGRPLVAHNAAFDLGALRAACHETASLCPELRYACSLVVARRTWKLLAYRLPFVAEAAGVAMEGQHHDAQSDADAAARVMLAAMDAHGVNSLDDLLGKLQIRYGSHNAVSGSWSTCRRRAYEKRPSIPQANQNADSEGMFFGRYVCITGTLGSMTRSEAQERLAAVGGQATPGVSRKTDILVVGTPDPSRFVPGMALSAKHRKARDLLDAGHDIEVLSEAEFLEQLSLSTSASRLDAEAALSRPCVSDA
ncbi:exonuclease domain-containing protein [Streptomyces sp. NBC_01693]|uniref:exonuclease domain-containing protein n=2 Tax=Streptomyces TaxID=1883 RepID=UPI0011CC443C|nr:MULTISPECIES: exonuclease domain-containing protein [unclassified Streptomyces]TXS09999.1 DNA polymerase III [Streptomyces sp. wa22]WSS63231.1 exonuclease domain-containing protein [Streptomyces sp. NBC_01177]WSS70228.1 exonuclease domain-containing protein [Streptomyces sp. NBC_01175]WSS77228.1 exonuclease domain-containing protein [Streptomyces sp. NBC_01174]MDX3433838.1 exonuclease domain-containing protein [Streptomyces sp. ME01-18a]